MKAALHKAGFYVDVDDSSKTFTRKLVEGQKAQYNFQLVVGDKREAREERVSSLKDSAS